VSDISRFANSQNAVRQSDLSANKPFHVDIERLSLSIYCPDGAGRWFYERAAGSYNTLLSREGDDASKVARVEGVRSDLAQDHEDRTCEIRDRLGRPARCGQPWNPKVLRPVHVGAGRSRGGGARAGSGRDVFQVAGRQGADIQGGPQDVPSVGFGVPRQRRGLHRRGGFTRLRGRPSTLSASGAGRGFRRSLSSRSRHGRVRSTSVYTKPPAAK
jgi:hypothetical protein